MKKTFDCVEMKRQIQEKLWIEAGETIEGLNRLLDEKIRNNKLLKDYYERKTAKSCIEI
ncbi:MAG: hypothetical protein WCR42_04825 [bacterium]